MLARQISSESQIPDSVSSLLCCVTEGVGTEKGSGIPFMEGIFPIPIVGLEYLELDAQATRKIPVGRNEDDLAISVASGTYP